MRLILTMPQPGETINEGVIVRWLKNPGDVVVEKEPLVELETEKAVFNYESPFEGKLISVEAKEGVSLPVGEPLAVFEVEATKAKGYLSLGIGRPLEGEVVKPSPESPSAPSLLLSPRLRVKARELGVSEAEIARMSGSGPAGRITEADLVARAGLTGKEKVEIAARARVVPPDVHRVAVTPVRRRIAENMERSKNEIPHAAAAVEVDLTELMRWKQIYGKVFSETHGIGLSFLPCFVWATAQAIGVVPNVNASWKGDIIELYDDIHMNLAIATSRGLFVPLLKGVRGKNFVEIAKEAGRLAAAAAAGTLRPEELTPGTITVNNHGAVGSVRAFQVIRYPQAAIIGFGKLVDRPWVLEGKIEIRKIAQVDLSFDHRLIDGDVAVKFLEAVRNELEHFSVKIP